MCKQPRRVVWWPQYITKASLFRYNYSFDLWSKITTHKPMASKKRKTPTYNNYLSFLTASIITMIALLLTVLFLLGLGLSMKLVVCYFQMRNWFALSFTQVRYSVSIETTRSSNCIDLAYLSKESDASFWWFRVTKERISRIIYIWFRVIIKRISHTQCILFRVVIDRISRIKYILFSVILKRISRI